MSDDLPIGILILEAAIAVPSICIFCMVKLGFGREGEPVDGDERHQDEPLSGDGPDG